MHVASPLVSVNPQAEAAVSVLPPPRVLVIASVAPQSLINALQTRGYDVAQTGPHNLPVDARAYLQYQAVVIANVTASALGDKAQFALNHYVADYGGGLVVTGDTLRDPNFHDSDLEKTLPINFEPQPPPPTREPIAVYLLIDRSNSMSYNSRYPAVRDGERIRYAKQAASALLNQLDDTDYAGVIAFDSEPYVLGHLRPLGEDRDELLNRVVRLEPGGGTDFKEALETAEREILASSIGVREVILLTDGDTNRQYHDHDDLMANYAREQIPVSTIRIGPDVENLRLLQDFAENTGGIFYRVEDITKLPQLLVNLTHEAENFKRHQHAHVTVQSRSAILNGIDPASIPPMDFFNQTDPKDGAEVPLRVEAATERAPLLITWQYQLGRSAVFAGDPDSMGSLAWIRWDHYAEFWSQLISWVSRSGDAGPFTLKLIGAPGGTLKIAVEEAGAMPVANLYARISGPGRSTDVALTQAGETLYSAESPPLPRGKYNVTLLVKSGDSERILLERPVAIAGPEAADSAELRLRPPDENLLRALAANTGGRYGAPADESLRPAGTLVKKLSQRRRGTVAHRNFTDARRGLRAAPPPRRLKAVRPPARMPPLALSNYLSGCSHGRPFHMARGTCRRLGIRPLGHISHASMAGAGDRSTIAWHDTPPECSISMSRADSMSRAEPARWAKPLTPERGLIRRRFLPQLFQLLGALLQAPLIDRLDVKTPVATDFEARQLAFFEQAIDRRTMHPQIIR